MFTKAEFLLTTSEYLELHNLHRPHVSSWSLSCHLACFYTSSFCFCDSTCDLHLFVLLLFYFVFFVHELFFFSYIVIILENKNLKL